MLKRIVFSLKFYAFLLLFIYAIPFKGLSQTNQITRPVFVDSARFKKGILNDGCLSTTYKYLKKANDYDSEDFGFTISSNGKVELSDLNSYTGQIGKFIKEHFNNYKWLPAHLQKCAKCYVKSYGSLNIKLTPPNKLIELKIDVDGIDKTIYNKTDRLVYHLVLPAKIIVK